MQIATSRVIVDGGSLYIKCQIKFPNCLSASWETGLNLKKLMELADYAAGKKAVPTKRRRRNLVILFNNTTITPFKWRGKYLCFYCGQDISDHAELIKHTKSHGKCDIKDFGIQSVRTGDFEVKLDVSEIVCEICSEAFVSLEEIVMHLMGKHKLVYDKEVDVHLTEYRLVDLTCLVCGESFGFFKHLVQHMNASHPKEVLVCEVCSQRFSKKRDLEAHTRNYHSKEGYKCDECDSEFASKTKLRAHKESQHLQTCNVCFEKFRSSAMKMKHINSVHLNKETLKCGFCRKVWKTKHAFLQHSSKCRIRKEVKQINDDNPQNTDIDDSDERKPIVRVLRNNLAYIFNMSTAIPFKFFMNRFRCFYCPKDFIEHEDLKQHSVLEHPVCDIKHRSMRLRARDNVDIKIDISTLKCKVCYQNIPDLNTLIDHLIIEHRVDYNKTVDCRILTFNLVKDSYLCPLCPDSEVYRFFGNLLKHMNGTHSNNKLICVFCGKAFRTDPNLRSHISRHHKAATFKCTECESIFHTGVILNSHMAKAHGKKVAKCPKCPERFVSTYLRQKHLITAHNFGATCPHCGRMFTRNSLMRDHIRRTHLKEKKVECQVCNMRFFDAFMLRMHMVRHDGDRNFQCDLCGKKFLWKKNLRNHMTTHEKHALTHMTDIHM